MVMFKGSKGQGKAESIDIPHLSWQGPKDRVCAGFAWTENKGDSESAGHCE